MGLVAAASLIWLLIRTGRKPSRITYPCQRAAVANIHIFLLVAFAPLLELKKIKRSIPSILGHRFTKTVLLVSSLLLAFGSVTFLSAYLPTPSDQFPIPLYLHSQRALSPVDTSDLFFVQNASGFEGNMDNALSTLLQLMEDHGTFFFKTAGHPSGLIGKADVVLIKVNCQWTQRGGTNTDLVKSLIKKVVDHPEGFLGEIVVADNGQGRGSLDWAESNAYDHSQSMQDVVNAFPSFKVSTWLWDSISSRSVNEYSQGDFNNGYVVNSTQDPVTQIRVSYPKFKTTYGTYISFKKGIWNTTTSSYDSGKLKIINVPVLKSHSNYGVTACVKHYMGVVTNSLGTNSHSAVRYGAMGSVMAEARFPTLNLLDAVWVNANPIEESSDCGPATSYDAASFTNVIGASQDPVALEYWASKYILIPTAIQLGYTAYSSLDPDYAPIAPGLSESYHNYLTRSMNELKNAGYQVTMNESEMNVYGSLAPVLPGDVNGDSKVDGKDIAIVSRAYNTTPSDPKWDARADINGDLKVDGKDIAIVARYYGTYYP